MTGDWDLNPIKLREVYRQELILAIRNNDRSWFLAKGELPFSYQNCRLLIPELPEDGRTVYKNRKGILRALRGGLSKEEVARLMKLKSEGFSLKKIAEILGQPFSTVRVTWHKLEKR